MPRPKSVSKLQCLALRVLCQRVAVACSRIEGSTLASDHTVRSEQVTQLMLQLPGRVLEDVILKSVEILARLVNKDRSSHGLHTALRLLPQHKVTKLDFGQLFFGVRLPLKLNQDCRASLTVSLKRATSLATLILCSKCTDDILAVVSKNCPGLEELNVSLSDQVTDVGLGYLWGEGGGEGGCWDLKTVDIQKCFSITPDGVAGMIRALSKLVMLKYANMSQVIYKLQPSSNLQSILAKNDKLKPKTEEVPVTVNGGTEEPPVTANGATDNDDVENEQENVQEPTKSAANGSIEVVQTSEILKKVTKPDPSSREEKSQYYKPIAVSQNTNSAFVPYLLQYFDQTDNPLDFETNKVFFEDLCVYYPYLNHAKVFIEDKDIDQLFHLKNLKKLHIEFVDDPSTGFRCLIQSIGSRLTSLSLQFQSMLFLDLQAIGSNCPKLTGLKLIGVEIDGSRHLQSRSGDFPSLTHLEVNLIGLENDSSDEENSEDESSLPNPELVHFFLDNCSLAIEVDLSLNCASFLTPDLLKSVLSTNKMEKLEKLSLSGSPTLLLTITTARWIIQALPSLSKLRLSRWTVSHKEISKLKNQLKQTNTNLVIL